ncbi:hypothetical protein BH09PSE4_BH09PSE4_20650 [soil metagenome]
MANAIWLLTALPSWYVGAAMAPFSAGALTLVPAMGLFSLAVGVILGAIGRRRELLWFLALVAASELLVVIGGAMRGQVRPNGPEGPLDAGLLLFLAAQFVVSGYLIYRIKGARAPASALGVFCVTYAAAAVFVAAMSFTDNWL